MLLNLTEGYDLSDLENIITDELRYLVRNNKLRWFDNNYLCLAWDYNQLIGYYKPSLLIILGYAPKRKTLDIEFKRAIEGYETINDDMMVSLFKEWSDWFGDFDSSDEKGPMEPIPEEKHSTVYNYTLSLDSLNNKSSLENPLWGTAKSQVREFDRDSEYQNAIYIVEQLRNIRALTNDDKDSN